MWRWVGFWPAELGRIAEVLLTRLKSWLRGLMTGVGCPGPRAKVRMDSWRLSSDFHVHSNACTPHTHKNIKIIKNCHLNKWYQERREYILTSMRKEEYKAFKVLWDQFIQLWTLGWAASCKMYKQWHVCDPGSGGNAEEVQAGRKWLEARTPIRKLTAASWEDMGTECRVLIIYHKREGDGGTVFKEIASTCCHSCL